MAIVLERIQLARGTAAQWTSANPVLMAGEIGWESDTNNFKMGDGVNTWHNLPYVISTDASPQTTLNGTTAGTAVSSMPAEGLTYKKFLVYLNGYRNSTSTAQTITYPVPFIHLPRLVADDAGCLATATTLTLPISMSAPVTGWVTLEGF